MKAQRRVSSENNGKFQGRRFEVIVDEKDGSGRDTWLGRTYMDAPEIDGLVYIKGTGIKTGDIVPVKITGTLEYDLIGEKEVMI